MRHHQRNFCACREGKTEVTGQAIRRWLPALALAALCVLGQSAPNSYRNLYRTWRDADPNLEADAATAPADALASRADKAAPLASAYAAAHAAALKAAADQQMQNLEWLSANVVQPLPDLASGPDEIRFANRESNAVSGSMATFANDPDRAIQQLRQAYQREQAALESLKASIISRQQTEEKAVAAAGAVEQARGRALQTYTFLTSNLSQSADAMNQEFLALASYYSKLAEAAKAPPEPAPAAPASASVAPRPASPTPVPLARYVGLWSYRPGPGAQYFGSEPETVDFTVHEANGHATGTFYARFKLGPGSTGDPVLRFEFSGDFKPSLKQSFQLTTAEGASGTVELTPGIAFNELEVNFTTDARPGKVSQADMILLKQ